MTCRKCQHDAVKKFGRRNNVQGYRCTSCSAVFTDQQPRMGSHYIRQNQAEKALLMMLEGMEAGITDHVWSLAELIAAA